MQQKPEIARILHTFRPFAVRVETSRAKYFPCCITALEEPFEAVRLNCFSGRSLAELYQQMGRHAEIGPLLQQ
jgi:hypothetical protein